MVGAHQNRPRPRFDAITANHSVRLSHGAVLKLQQHFPRRQPVIHQVIQPLIKLRAIPRQQLGKLIQKPRPMDRILADAGIDHREQGLEARGGLVGHAVHEVEPGALLRVPLVARADDVEGAQHAAVDELHGFDGVAGDGHARADLAELGRLLVDGGLDVALVQGDGEHEPGDAAADDGELEGLWGWFGGHFGWCGAPRRCMFGVGLFCWYRYF